MKKLILLALVAFVMLSALKCKEKGGDQPSPKTYAVLALNEGAFNHANGGLTAYNPDTKESIQEYYRTQNGKDAGDVVQSATKIGDKIYLVINNSKEIQVLSASDLKLQTTIAENFSPRYLVDLKDGRAMVSDFNGGVHILSLSTNKILSTITTPSWTEALLKRGDNVYVTLPTEGQIWSYSISKASFIDQVDVAGQPVQLFDGSGPEFWAFSTTYPNTSCHLIKLEEGGDSWGESQTYNYPQYGYFAEVQKSADKFYMVNGDLYTASASDPLELQETNFSTSGKNIYSLGIDPSNGEIYLGDAKDYASNGNAYRLSPSMQLLDSFSTGIAPGAFFFNR